MGRRTSGLSRRLSRLLTAAAMRSSPSRASPESPPWTRASKEHGQEAAGTAAARGRRQGPKPTPAWRGARKTPPMAAPRRRGGPKRRWRGRATRTDPRCRSGPLWWAPRRPSGPPPRRCARTGPPSSPSSRRTYPTATAPRRAAGHRSRRPAPPKRAAKSRAPKTPRAGGDWWGVSAEMTGDKARNQGQYLRILFTRPSRLNQSSFVSVRLKARWWKCKLPIQQNPSAHREIGVALCAFL
mmetsp:Transcript_21001/g.47387  ORF Transcript_21001/g.47387 Transcript_21001/m.47387 type:complete len:240 (+) Transcript_21001:195-914(+)